MPLPFRRPVGAADRAGVDRPGRGRPDGRGRATEYAA